MSRSELNISRWLEAHSDRNAGLKTIPSNIVLADVSGDGDHRLVLADIKLEPDTRSRLKVYKGTLLTSDQTLPDVPSSVISFHTDSLEPKVPAIGVACGSDFLIYKNSKPYFKFTVPPLPLNALEEDIWTKIATRNIDLTQAIDDLKTVNYNLLSARTQQLLTIHPTEIFDYVNKYRGLEPKNNVTITCMSTISRSSQEENAISCPIIATEAGQIYILDPQSFTILHQATVSTIKLSPAIIKTVGLFDVEYRILVACREGYVCLLRRGWLEGRCILQTTSHIVDMVVIPGDQFIAIATSDKVLQCYTKKGNKLWSIKLKSAITCLCLIPLKHLSTSLLAVGLHGGIIQIYKGRHPVDVVTAPDSPSALIFGQMGQEEHVMILVTISGILDFKILKRTADFSLSEQDSVLSPTLHTKPLPLPKRSKLFLEQSARERQNALDMHQHFQQDLIRLRLNAARAMVQNQSDQTGIGNDKELIKLSAQVLGLGPKFSLILTLENMNTEKPLTQLSIVFHTKPTVYKLSTYLINVPLVPPSLSYKLETKVEEVSLDNSVNQQGGNLATNQAIKVFCVRKGQAQPVLAATINMPPTDYTIPVL